MSNSEKHIDPCLLEAFGDTSLSPSEVLKHLNQVLAHVKEKVFEWEIDGLGEFSYDCPGHEYRKKTLVELETSFGKLGCYDICFPEELFTFPHTHPSYTLELILKGSLREELFSGNRQEGFKLKEVQVASEGEVKSSFDPAGRPHRVAGHKGSCRVLLMTLGDNLDDCSIEL